MYKVGITGGIGSGKSVVSNIFRVLGIPVFDADKTARRLMEEDPELREGLIALFGPESFAEGKLNRRYISNIVFKDPFELEKLNALVHPAAIAAGERWAEAQNAPYTIKEAALFFESGSAAGLDLVVGVYSPKSIRISRVMNRDGISREEVLDRMSKQIDEEMKMRLCDRVILNNDTELLIPQVLQLHHELLTRS